jgi:guanine deaminase
MGSDVGAGTGFSMFKEGLQAYFLQRLLGADGVPLTSAHLLWLTTAAGARALGLEREVGDLSAGKRFDAVLLQPAPGTPLAVGLRHADGPDEALARVFALATTSDIRTVWIDGAEAGARAGAERPLARVVGPREGRTA